MADPETPTDPKTKSDSAPLDDVMLAMDVVDSVRHDERLALRELDDAARREELGARLKRIYAAQGIDVTDAMIAEGVAALDAARFAYTPAPLSFETLLARLWVWRGWVAAGLAALVIVAGLGWLAYDNAVLGPRREIAAKADAAFAAIADGEATPEAAARAQGLVGEVRAALAAGNMGEAARALGQLQVLRASLPLAYELRIIEALSQARGNAPHIRDHAFLVDVIGPDGAPLEIEMTDSGGEVRRVSRFALPVSQDSYVAIQREERAGGTLADVAPLAVKRPGEPAPDYRVPITGAPAFPSEGGS